MLARSFAWLIRDLVTAHHPDGGMVAMARKTGIHYSTIYRWDTVGVLGEPEWDKILKLAAAYHLDPEEVRQLAKRDQAKRLLGQPVPTPPEIVRKRGPKPPRLRSVRRHLAAFALALSTTSMVPAHAGTLQDGPAVADARHSVKYGRRRRRARRRGILHRPWALRLAA